MTTHNPAQHRFDVAIVGCGLVGLAAALALAQQGLRIALIGPAEKSSEQDWDSRIYALNPGNQAWLDALRVWGEVDIQRCAPVYDMRIFGAETAAAALHFSAYQARLGQLAWIVENRELLRVLRLGCRMQSNLQTFAVQAQALEVSDAQATLTLADGKTLSAALIVGADGANSWVRQQAGIATQERDYHQTAVVANFHCSAAHLDTAYQWFRDDGVLALLPLPGQRVSMVWSAHQETAQTLQQISADALCEKVAQAAQGKLGTLELITPPAAFPLRLRQAASMTAPRVALIGDAAHVIHPLAGQGMNLGLQDAHDLAQVIAAREAFRDCGDARVLARYARARAEDVLLMRTVTDGLQRLFGTDDPIAQKLRKEGMACLDKLPLLKSALIRHAAGQ